MRPFARCNPHEAIRTMVSAQALRRVTRATAAIKDYNCHERHKGHDSYEGQDGHWCHDGNWSHDGHWGHNSHKGCGRIRKLLAIQAFSALAHLRLEPRRGFNGVAHQHLGRNLISCVSALIEDQRTYVTKVDRLTREHLSTYTSKVKVYTFQKLAHLEYILPVGARTSFRSTYLHPMGASTPYGYTCSKCWTCVFIHRLASSYQVGILDLGQKRIFWPSLDQWDLQVF